MWKWLEFSRSFLFCIFGDLFSAASPQQDDLLLHRGHLWYLRVKHNELEESSQLDMVSPEKDFYPENQLDQEQCVH